MSTEIQRGSVVTVTGHGRTKTWGKLTGTVTRRRGRLVLVRWVGTSFEDEMDLEEVQLASPERP